ncbi:hypothetical protein J2T16_003450 [Paenibacillus intestini]|nr:hypothetical protein [Paenibacillus intestini]
MPSFSLSLIDQKDYKLEPFPIGAFALFFM